MNLPTIHPATPVWDFPKYEPGQKVALFIPCYIDQFYPSIGKATVELLEQVGIKADFPDTQTCCGQPAFNSGYWNEARKVIRGFRDAFDGYDWIVTPSSSCAAMARVFFKQADPSPESAEVGSKVFELTEFLVNVLGKTDFGARYPHKVTVHIGCHGRRELGIIESPFRLLQNVQEMEYVELPYFDECCGFGGTFSVKMAGTSIKMGRRKAEKILETGADAVVTPDISCMMHVGGIMQRDPTMKHVKILHIAELLVQK